MHFKRNLWLSFTGASIIVIAVLFGTKHSEANSDEQHSLPQMNQSQSQAQAKPESEQHSTLPAQTRTPIPT